MRRMRPGKRIPAMLLLLAMGSVLLTGCTEREQAGQETPVPQETVSVTEVAVTEEPAAEKAELIGELWQDGKYQEVDMSGYQWMDDPLNTNFREMTGREVVSEYDEYKTFIVIFSNEKCDHCQVAMPVVAEFAKETGVGIGYVNTRKDPAWNSNTDIDGYALIVKRFGEFFLLDNFDRPHMYVPHIFFIKNGEVAAQGMLSLPEGADEHAPIDEENRENIMTFLNNSYKTMLDTVVS